MNELTDAQWCFLDLLMQAKKRGVTRVHRLEILSSQSIPKEAAMKLVWAGLGLAAGEFVALHDLHDFEITPAGEQVYQARFGTDAAPTSAADTVIHLPGAGGYQN